jgi:hypothetical protein
MIIPTKFKYRYWNYATKAWQMSEPVDDPYCKVFETSKLDKHSNMIYDYDCVTYIEKMHEHGDAQELSGVVIWSAVDAAWAIGTPEGEVWNLLSDGCIRDIIITGNLFENDF